MCGIVGYIGKKEALPILLRGLTRLEYRGYDSAGIAIQNDGMITRVRSVGKIANLTEKSNYIQTAGKITIAAAISGVLVFAFVFLLTPCSLVVH